MASMESDLILLERFKQTGDTEAFREIVRRYTGAVFATCHRILHDPGSAEDAAQETFYRLMTRPQRVTASLGGWLHRAATRLALDIRRSDVSRRRREVAYASPQPPAASNWADVAPKLDEALAALPDGPRELLVRHFLRGEPQADLAAEAQTSPATLSRRIKAAVDALRQELASRGVSVTPGLLLTLLGRDGIGAAPAGLKLALGKMALFCTARSTAAHPTSGASALRSLPRLASSLRWAFAGAALSLVAAMLAAALIRHVSMSASGMAEPGLNQRAIDPPALVRRSSNHE